MTTTTATNRTKKQRTLSYNPRVGSLHVTDERGRTVGYWLDRLPCDFGVAVRLTKIIAPEDGGADHYDTLASDDGKADSCECLGWLRYAKCKHVAALRCLRSRGSP